MKTKLLFLIFALCLLRVPLSLAQPSSLPKKATSPQRQIYMMSTYGITSAQAKEYDAILSEKNQKETAARNRVLSAPNYDKQINGVYAGFCTKVSSIFSKSQYSKWIAATNTHERYRFLTEERQLTPEKAILVFEIQKEFQEGKANLNNSTSTSDQKALLIKQLDDNYNSRLVSTLGNSLAAEYLQIEKLYYGSVRLIKKLNVSYNAANQIVLAQMEYDAKTKNMRAEKMRKTAREDVKGKASQAMSLRLRAVLTKEDFAKWEKYNENSLLYSLATDYGLSKAQIEQFKGIYNEYAIAKYKITNSKSSKGEKITALKDAEAQFRLKAQNIFPPDKYKQWIVRRKYTSSRHHK